MNSLRRQLALGLAAGSVLLLLLLFLGVSATLRTLAEEQTRTRLEHDAETLLTALDLGGDAPRLQDAGIHPIYRRPLGGHYFVVRVDGVELRSRSLWDARLAEPATPLAHVTGPQGEPLLALTGHYTKRDRAVSITVAEELTALEASLAAFQWRYALATVLLLLALLAVQQLVLHRALRPLDATRAELARLQHGEVTALQERGPDELVPLVRAFNAALAAMQRRTERSRKAAGNLAHALKAPLAVLGQLRDHPDLRDRAALRGTLDGELDRLGHTVERELRRARTVGYAPPGTRVDLAEVLGELVTTLGRLHRERGLELTLEAHGPLPVALDRHDLFEVCGNLLDNACKWARGRITVSVAPGTETTVLAIEDDGPGVADSEIENLVRRGQRLDESVPGHGLGLAIVADILAEYGGTLTLGRAADLGGLRAEVTLPRGTPAGSA